MLFGRPRADAATRAQLAAAHADRFGRPPSRSLAAARGPAGWCFLLPECLAYEQGGEWRFVLWHEIEQGSWNDQNRELRWEELGGRRGRVLLDHPARVPEVFKERVQASIVLQQQVPIEGTREGGVVSAEQLLEQAWDENADPFTNAVRITVSALRKRLGEPWLIATVPGVGYRIDAGSAPAGGERG